MTHLTDLEIALESEVLGEAFFRAAYYAAFFLNRGNKAKVLWQLEAQTKRRIIEYFEVNNLEVPKLRRAIAKGSILGAFYPVFPWYILMQEILKETGCYLDVFRRLEEGAVGKDKELFEYIVAHEIAIAHFAKIELANNGNKSLELIEALLNEQHAL